MREYKIIDHLRSNQTPLLIFLISFFIFTGFGSTRLFLSDEGVTVNQFYNLFQGSLSIETGKMNVINGVYLILDDHIYGKFSYSLLILSLPVYYILRSIDFLYGAHLFLLQLWALSGGIIIYLIVKMRGIKHAEIMGTVSYLFLIAINMYFFKPINFPVWGEVIAIEFTNILITSFSILLVYLLFKNLFNSKIAIFAVFFIILATPISFYATTLKLHPLSLLLTLLAFYLLYKYLEKKDNKYMYFAYALAGFCVWTRILDGVILLVAILIIDFLIFRRNIKYILSISIIILISLMPFFTFNYLILGSPFSIMETSQSDNKILSMQPARDAIILYEEQTKPKQIELLKNLGYSKNTEIRDDWFNVLLYATFLKLQNTFGILLVSPFLVIAFAFLIDRIKQKIKLNKIDKFFGLFAILFVLFYKKYLLTIVVDSVYVIEYRYLLILYIIFLYFALRIDRIKDMIEKKLEKIIMSYCLLLLIGSIYFIAEFPIPFMKVYYHVALITSISLLIIISTNLLVTDKRFITGLLDNLLLFIVALSLSLATMFLLFYYWIANMTYISPTQNFTILPVFQIILEWMYRIVLKI